VTTWRIFERACIVKGLNSSELCRSSKLNRSVGWKVIVLFSVIDTYSPQLSLLLMSSASFTKDTVKQSWFFIFRLYLQLTTTTNLKPYLTHLFTCTFHWFSMHKSLKYFSLKKDWILLTHSWWLTNKIKIRKLTKIAWGAWAIVALLMFAWIWQKSQ